MNEKKQVIGIDVSMLVYQGSGVANYTYNMVKHLLLLDQKNEYKLFYSSFRRPKNFYYLDEFRSLGAKVFDYKFPPRILELFWNKWHILPVELLIGKVDWYFSSDFLRPPLFKNTKGITTIHDLTWKVFPQFHTKKIVDAHHKKMNLTIKSGDFIIADSKSTANDIIKFYPQVIGHNKVEIINPGIDDRFRIIKNDKEITNVLKKYNVVYPHKYLLYVGAIEPRKNLDTAIKIFSELIKDSLYSDFEFLIVGRAGWKNEQIFELIKKLNLENKIKFIGFVEDDDLPYFYNACSVNIYLSKYEGFGLPPVEAAACGKQTLLYSNSSLGELFPNSKMYAKKGEELEQLKKLIKNNFAHKETTFTWNSFVKKILNVIECNL